MSNWERFKNTSYLANSEGFIYNEATDTLLQPFLNNSGYEQVDLFVNTVKQRVAVHRIIAICFVPNPENKPHVNHIDGNKRNNAASNLEWCTPSENAIHSYEAGLQKKGSEKTLAKLTEEDVLKIQEMFREGKLCNQQIAELYGVTSGVISAIRLGKTWTHVSGEVFGPCGPNPVRKLQAYDIPVIRELIASGATDADIGRVFKVARGTINQIRQGKTWRNY